VTVYFEISLQNVSYRPTAEDRAPARHDDSRAWLMREFNVSYYSGDDANETQTVC
jgi:hypothetical protein